ncbi:MAG: hypothetical protein NT076_02475 [Candidatus Pacearchaeota archaeon]|nr:hypothetical protein [Candidatus Pacearchaeota archaeon]
MKFIRFDGFEVSNHKGEYLGNISLKEWKVHTQYVFNPDLETFFTAGCLKEIEEKLEELNRGLKNGKE